jgi:hypothetical protein
MVGVLRMLGDGWDVTARPIPSVKEANVRGFFQCLDERAVQRAKKRDLRLKFPRPCGKDLFRARIVGGTIIDADEIPDRFSIICGFARAKRPARLRTRHKINARFGG